MTDFTDNHKSPSPPKSDKVKSEGSKREQSPIISSKDEEYTTINGDDDIITNTQTSANIP